MSLSNADDNDAWGEFIDVYGNALHRFGLIRGLQHSDATELVQEVLLGVSKAIKTYQPDPERAKFRTWLFRIAQRQYAKQIRKRKYLTNNLSTGFWNTASAASTSSPCLTLIQKEESELALVRMQWAMKIVQSQVKQSTWQAFSGSYIEKRPITEVAGELGVSSDYVYVARSRVIKRIRHELDSLLSEENHALHRI